jgi:nucleoside-triphosphatase
VSEPVRSPKLLITGPPKIGKSTAINRLVHLLRERGIVVGGFVTHERLDHGRRVGFVVQDLAGPEAVIAHQDYNTGIRVSRFGVDVPAFERVGIPALRRAVDQGGIVVIDEIARMELASEAFVQVVERVINAPRPVVASVHVRAHPFTDALKQRAEVELLTLTLDNRDAVPDILLSRLTST